MKAQTPLSEEEQKEIYLAGRKQSIRLDLDYLQWYSRIMNVELTGSNPVTENELVMSVVGKVARYIGI